jgi:methylmalonyl-CoA mutase C-terminal domain/subunit
MRPIRVLVAVCGYDGHDKAVRIVAKLFRDAGMEVVYAGLRQTPQMVVETAIQEDVDFIGISSHTGAHMRVFSSILEGLDRQSARDIRICGGGVISRADKAALEAMGVSRIFLPGTLDADILHYMSTAADPDCVKPSLPALHACSGLRAADAPVREGRPDS